MPAPPTRATTALAVGTLVVAALAGCTAPSPTGTASPTAKPSAVRTSDPAIAPTQSIIPSDTPVPTPSATSSAASTSVESIAPTDAPAIVNTVWTGTRQFDGYPSHDVAFTFQPDGSVTYDEAGDHVDGVTWQRTGDDVTISIDNGFSTWTGSISDTTLAGTIVNVTGSSGAFSLTKQ